MNSRRFATPSPPSRRSARAGVVFLLFVLLSCVAPRSSTRFMLIISTYMLGVRVVLNILVLLKSEPTKQNQRAQRNENTARQEERR